MIGAYRPVQAPRLQQELQSPGYRYREYAPDKRLSPYVACYWTLDYAARGREQPHRILPDGCVDIIVDRLAPSREGASFVAGLMTSFQVLTLTGVQSLFGIRMFVEAAPAILRFPVSESVGQQLFLEDVWGSEGLELAETLLSADSVPLMIEAMERKLRERLAVEDAPGSALLRAGLQYMYSSGGSLSMAELAERLHFSERHVRRTFERELGVSPKELLGIVRFQSMLQRLCQGDFSNMAELAAACGYYDQAHFIKSFQRYYGLAPGQVVKACRPLPESISQSNGRNVFPQQL